jgi:hypothetical protein
MLQLEQGRERRRARYATIPRSLWILGAKSSSRCAGPPGQIGWHTGKNLSALVDISGQWIDRVHTRRAKDAGDNVIWVMSSSVMRVTAGPSDMCYAVG